MNCADMLSYNTIQRSPTILFLECQPSKNISQKRLVPLVMLILCFHKQSPLNFGGTWSENGKKAAKLYCVERATCTITFISCFLRVFKSCMARGKRLVKTIVYVALKNNLVIPWGPRSLHQTYSDLNKLCP
jgi:hypothetical protein